MVYGRDSSTTPAYVVDDFSDHITDVLACLHWLRIQYKITVLAYTVLNGTALFGYLVFVTDLPGRRSLRSAGTDRLVIPPFKLFTYGFFAMFLLKTAIFLFDLGHFSIKRLHRCSFFQ